MKPAIALLATFIVACTGAPAKPDANLTPLGDSCAIARPDFGAVATEADLKLFAYDVAAPLNLQKSVESTSNGVERSAISFSSPAGGSVTGLLSDPTAALDRPSGSSRPIGPSRSS